MAMFVVTLPTRSLLTTLIYIGLSLILTSKKEHVLMFVLLGTAQQSQLQLVQLLQTVKVTPMMLQLMTKEM